MENVNNNQPVPVNEQLRLVAFNKINDTFSKDQIAIFNALNQDIVQFFADYYVLIDDLDHIKEEYRKCFYDYSFVISPVHKGLEAYLKAVFPSAFSLKVSSKRGERIGYYLKKEDKEVIEIIEKVKDKHKLDFSADSWVDRWNGLENAWFYNRNPQSHSDGERIDTFRKAKNIASTIFREIELSSKSLLDDFYLPVINKSNKQD